MDQVAQRELQRMLDPSASLEGILEDVARRHAALVTAPTLTNDHDRESPVAV